MKIANMILVLGLLLPFGTVAQEYVGPPEDIEAILANAKQFSKYFVEGDMEGIVDSYTENGKIFPTGRDIMSGREDLADYWQTNPDVKAIYHKLTPLSIEICGDKATDYGYYEGITQYNDNPPSKWKGKYVVIWKKVEGLWKMDVDIWNKINLPTIEDRFQSILDSIFSAHPQAVGTIIHVEAPDKNISWTGAVGHAEKGGTSPLQVAQPVLTASNTKTYVAAAILRLIEKGNINLDQPIQKLLSNKTHKQFKKAGYDLNTISVKHLLSHTSGIVDYVDKEYFQFVIDNPKHRWTRAEQMKRATTDRSPTNAPGTAYDYADVNFVLLTEIIEEQLNKPFNTAIRQLLKFDQLGLNHTWFHTLEAIPEGTADMAHQYVTEKGFDSYELDPSWDLYGGGGMASTASDLALFFQYLFSGHIVQDQKLLSLMTTYVLPVEKSNYCLGNFKLDFHNTEAYYHGGYWGTDAMYIPEFNMTISGFTLEKADRNINAEVSAKILALMKN